jgi:hypothetical protein
MLSDVLYDAVSEIDPYLEDFQPLYSVSRRDSEGAGGYG